MYEPLARWRQFDGTPEEMAVLILSGNLFHRVIDVMHRYGANSKFWPVRGFILQSLPMRAYWTWEIPRF